MVLETQKMALEKAEAELGYYDRYSDHAQRQHPWPGIRQEQAGHMKPNQVVEVDAITDLAQTRDRAKRQKRGQDVILAHHDGGDAQRHQAVNKLPQPHNAPG